MCRGTGTTRRCIEEKSCLGNKWCTCCLLRRELNISDERWVVNPDSQFADYNLLSTRKFLSHEKQISDCFHVNKVKCVNALNKKTLILLTAQSNLLWVEGKYFYQTTWETRVFLLQWRAKQWPQESGIKLSTEFLINTESNFLLKLILSFLCLNEWQRRFFYRLLERVYASESSRQH